MRSYAHTLLSTLAISLCLLCSACNNVAKPQAAAVPDAQISYDSLRAQVKQVQAAIHKQYRSADSATQDSIIKATRVYLLDVIHQSFFARWYNTPWEFYGTTQKPQQGSIACGYFVTTIMQHAGFNIPRVAWAQLPSESMMKKLQLQLRHFPNKSIEDFEKHFASKPDGLYIVGLDSHVGFISKYKGKLQFIHSNYYQRSIGVMAEALNGYNPLSHSKYRVLGNVLDDNAVKHWIEGYKYK